MDDLGLRRYAHVLLSPEVSLDEKRPQLAHYLQDAGLASGFSLEDLEVAIETLVRSVPKRQSQRKLGVVIDEILTKR